MKKFLLLMLVLMVSIIGTSWSQTILPNSNPLLETKSVTPQIDIDLLEAIQNLPLQGTTPEGFLIVAVDPFMDWTSFLMTSFYTIGAADQIRKYVPIMKTKDKIIEEKDILIEHLEDYKIKLLADNADKQMTISAQVLEISDRDILIDKWKTRFWVAAGIGIVSTGLAVASLLF